MNAPLIPACLPTITPRIPSSNTNPRALLTLLLSNPIALTINSINAPSKATSSSKEHVRKRFAAACAVMGRAYDVGGTKVTVYKW